MCPLWSQAHWGAQKWGVGGLPELPDLFRKLLSAPHPWVLALGIQNYWRGATWEVWTVDPTSLENVTQLPHLAGGVRESALEDEAVQHEGLTLTFMNPDEYLPGGAYASLVAPDTLWRLTWQVSSQYGSGTLPTGLYRVTQAPSLTVDGKAVQTPQAVAEGWLEKPLNDLLLSGSNPLGDAIALRDNVLLPTGGPIIWNVDTYATLVAAVVYTASGHRLRVPQPWRTLNWWGTSSPVPTEPPPPAPPPGTVSPTVALQVVPGSAVNGAATEFTISFNLSGIDPTGGDAIFWGPGNLSTAQASQAAAGEPADSPYLLTTYGQPNGAQTVTLSPNFGAPGARFWYWHRVIGCIENSSALVVLT